MGWLMRVFVACDFPRGPVRWLTAAGFALTAGVAREWRRMDEGLPPTVP